MRAARGTTGLLATLAFTLVFCAPIGALAQTNPPAKPVAAASAPPGFALPDVVTEPRLGDLDSMLQYHLIRILVPYSKTFYFVDRGVQHGLIYEFGQQLEKDLNATRKRTALRVHVVCVPVARDEIIPYLLAGRGDVGMANLTITPERLKQVDFTTPHTKNVAEILVTGPGAEPVRSVQELSGKEVYIRKSSSYYESIERLNREFAQAGQAPVKVRLAPETLESEDILEMVNAGLVKATIMDSHIAAFWRQLFPQLTLHPEVAVHTGGQIAWMLRKDSPQFKAALDAEIARYPEGSAQRNVIFQKYLQSTKWVVAAGAPTELAKFEATVAFFRKYAEHYGLDYLLMMAQGFQESQLNQALRSPVGAIGVMQLMPATGKEMAVGDIRQIEPNIHAGVKYVRFMMDQYYAAEPMERLNKGLFTFASYNAGASRIEQMRQLAAKRGLDPNKWFNNVEVVVSEKIGRETVTYVSNIYKYYLAYRMITEEHQEREKVRDTIWRSESQ